MASFIKFCQIVVELSHGNKSVEEQEEVEEEEEEETETKTMSPVTQGDINMLFHFSTCFVYTTMIIYKQTTLHVFSIPLR